MKKNNTTPNPQKNDFVNELLRRIFDPDYQFDHAYDTQVQAFFQKHK